jgi:alginate O-acetyltransferase complex protein AlgI
LPSVLEGWLAMIGIVFVLHFGVFHLLSCAWRHIGVATEPLMNWPIFSTSLSEFWSRRWNRAFRDLTHRFLFRPLTPRIGPIPALLVGFLISGAIHDLVISVPAEGGYGGPTAYFAFQGAGIVAERSRMGRRMRLGRGFSGWLFTATVVVGPAGWLFPLAFLERIILPFVAALGGLI